MENKKEKERFTGYINYLRSVKSTPLGETLGKLEMDIELTQENLKTMLERKHIIEAKMAALEGNYEVETIVAVPHFVTRHRA